MKCLFCEKEGITEHHILPKVIRRSMGWNGKRATEALADKTTPMCEECHRKLNLLQEPLIKIIKYLRSSPPVPVEFAFIMDGVYKELNGNIIVDGEV